MTRLVHALALAFALCTCAFTVAAAAPKAPKTRPASAAAPVAGDDLEKARAIFAANLDAIRHRDREAYLACYLESESLVRAGPAGFRLGYEDLASETSRNEWPDFLDASDLRLTPVQDGIVYGTYRYRVRYGDNEQSGLSERLFVRTPQGWRIAITSAFQAPPGTPPPPRVLVGATLVDGTGKAPIRDAVVALRDGKIEYAGRRDLYPIPSGVDTLDVRGTWITPGLVDAHVHFSQTGWADGRPDALDLRAQYPYEEVQERQRSHPERWFRCYLCSGVTAVFDVGGYPWTLDLEERTKNDTRAPHVVAAGPLLSTLDFWLNLPAERQFIYLSGDSAARAGVRYLASQGASAVKVWFIVYPGRDFDEMARAVQAAGEEARQVGLPLIVHATGLKEAKVALRAGARLLVHSVWDVPVDREFIDLAKRADAIYCPTLTVADGYVRLFESARSGAKKRVPVIDDPNGCVDAEMRSLIESTPVVAGKLVDTGRIPSTDNAKRNKIMAANLRAVHKAGIAIAMGTDAGNPLTLHGPSVYAEMEAMQAAGLSPMNVLVASTRGGALAMGRLHDIGTVEAGKSADLLVVDADPTRDIANLRRLRYVVRGGAVRPLGELRVAPPSAGSRRSRP